MSRKKIENKTVVLDTSAIVLGSNSLLGTIVAEVGPTFPLENVCVELYFLKECEEGTTFFISKEEAKLVDDQVKQLKELGITVQMMIA